MQYRYELRNRKRPLQGRSSTGIAVTVQKAEINARPILKSFVSLRRSYCNWCTRVYKNSTTVPVEVPVLVVVEIKRIRVIITHHMIRMTLRHRCNIPLTSTPSFRPVWWYELRRTGSDMWRAACGFPLALGSFCSHRLKTCWAYLAC